MLKAIFGRMEQAGKAFGRGRSPQIMRAIMNFRYALKIRTERGNLSPEQIRKVAEAIDAAARVIDEVGGNRGFSDPEPGRHAHQSCMKYPG